MTAKRARGIGNAGRLIAAIGGRSAGLRGFAAVRAETVAARHAEGIQLANSRVTDASAAIVARRRGAARVVLVVTDIALRIAAPRVAADADRRALVLFADDVAVTREARASRSAAVTRLATEIAVHVAARRRLTDHHASGAVGRAEAAATVVAGTAQGAVYAVLAIGRPRRRRITGTESLAARDGARARATVGRFGAHVARLNAERRSELAVAAGAKPRATVSVRRAGIPGGVTRRSEWRALSGSAGATAATRIRTADLVVRNASRRGTLPAHAAEATALRGRSAGSGRRGAGADARRAGVGRRVAELRAAVGTRLTDVGVPMTGRG